MSGTTDRAAGAHARRGRAAVLIAAVLSLMVGLGGCSDDADDSSGAGGAGGDSASAAIETDARIGKVRGTLDAAAEAETVAEITALADRWFDAGYGGDYPRSEIDAAFADFTKDAKALALDQAPIMSNAAVGADLEAVEITQRRVRIDVLAPEGKVAGATARIELGLALSGGVERTDRVVGRLLLTPSKDGWKVFGFDIRRDEGVS